MVFAFAFGSVYAGDKSGEFIGVMSEGTTITTGNSGSVESSSAGGLRAADPAKVIQNGVTDFTGRTYDSLCIPAEGTTMNSRSVESSSAGSLRAANSAQSLQNGVTDFTGGTYDIL